MIDPSDTLGKWEKRWHPLRNEWIVYAAHRNNRPWIGQSAKINHTPLSYDPTCYLCPGNKRVHDTINPDYKDIFIFDNDHPVVGAEAPEISPEYQLTGDGLYLREKAFGIARVVCYDPRHNVTLSELSLEKVRKVFQAWRTQTKELAEIPKIKYAFIFENKGESVGVSNPHPHCQIYATDFIFKLVEQYLSAGEIYKKEKGKNIFSQIIENEQKDQLRIIAENKGAIAFIPFFARYAYEVMVFPKKRHATLITMSDEELDDLAKVFQEVIRRYDMNFAMSFPYVMSILQAPIDGKEYPEYHLHLFLQPPLRQPGLIKYLAGPEIGGGNFMADTMPEEKAAELRSVVIS